MNDAAPSSQPRHALLSGGGTGGHVFPALAVGDELLARGWRVSYAGSAHGPEARWVAERGLPFHALPARPFLGRGPAAKVAALSTFVRSGLAARNLIRKLKIDAVLGTGGYAAAPAMLGARLAGVPSLLLELNARAGVANAWLSRLAREGAVAFEETKSDLHCPSTVTGVPVRKEFFAIPAELPSGPARLFVMGGSQGSKEINDLLLATLPRLMAADSDLSALHQVGGKNVDAVRDAYAQSGLGSSLESGRLQIVPFVSNVPAELAKSHLVIARAGAVTVAELCAAGRPALFVPLTIAKGHQVENARLLEKAGAAEVLISPYPDVFHDRVQALLADRAGLAARATKAKNLSRPNAAAALADRLEALASRRTKGGAR